MRGRVELTFGKRPEVYGVVVVVVVVPVPVPVPGGRVAGQPDRRGGRLVLVTGHVLAALSGVRVRVRVLVPVRVPVPVPVPAPPTDSVPVLTDCFLLSPHFTHRTLDYSYCTIFYFILLNNQIFTITIGNNIF